VEFQHYGRSRTIDYYNVATATLLISTSFSTMQASDAQSVAGVHPSGTVTLSETFVAG
jgi:hypothetical protein